MNNLKCLKQGFNNNGENIYVSNEDIKESIAKTVRNKGQKKFLSEHMEVFKNLDKIIEQGQIIAKSTEIKNRPQYQNWDYYATPATIDGENILFSLTQYYEIMDKNILD